MELVLLRDVFFRETPEGPNNTSSMIEIPRLVSVSYEFSFCRIHTHHSLSSRISTCWSLPEFIDFNLLVTTPSSGISTCWSLSEQKTRCLFRPIHSIGGETNTLFLGQNNKQDGRPSSFFWSTRGRIGPLEPLAQNRFG